MGNACCGRSEPQRLFQCDPPTIEDAYTAIRLRPTGEHTMLSDLTAEQTTTSATRDTSFDEDTRTALKALFDEEEQVFEHKDDMRRNPFTPQAAAVLTISRTKTDGLQTTTALATPDNTEQGFFDSVPARRALTDQALSFQATEVPERSASRRVELTHKRRRATTEDDEMKKATKRKRCTQPRARIQKRRLERKRPQTDLVRDPLTDTAPTVTTRIPIRHRPFDKQIIILTRSPRDKPDDTGSQSSSSNSEEDIKHNTNRILGLELRLLPRLLPEKSPFTERCIDDSRKGYTTSLQRPATSRVCALDAAK